MRVLGFDAPGGRAGAWAVVDDRRGGTLSGVGDILFDANESEQDHYRKLNDVFHDATSLIQYDVGLFVIEAAFLFKIAPYVGAAKMYAATKRVPWVMLGSSSARKLVLGHGGPGKAAKAEVLAAMVARFGARRITNQHRADACLYALAGFSWLVKNGEPR